MRRFTGQFTIADCDKAIKEIEAAHNAEMYSELMYLHKWLRLFMDNTDVILEGYENGVDSMGAPMMKSTEIWRQEVLHFKSKKARLQDALDLADKYTPFKEAA